MTQPPLGGCVLKQVEYLDRDNDYNQPPLGGCVLKHSEWARNRKQPISRL